MKNISTLCLLLLFTCCAALTANAQRSFDSSATPFRSSSATFIAATAGAQDEQSELKAIGKLPPAERIQKLKAFVKAHPQSLLKERVLELIVAAHAAFGDELLAEGDQQGGRAQFQ